MELSNTIFSWRTKKVDNGIEYTVTKKVCLKQDFHGRYTFDLKVKSGVFPTRHKAKSKAIAWVKYFKACNAKELDARKTYAGEDLSTLEDKGFMIIVDTIKGVVDLEFENGLYKIGNFFKTTNRDDAFNVIASIYSSSTK